MTDQMLKGDMSQIMSKNPEGSETHDAVPGRSQRDIASPDHLVRRSEDGWLRISGPTTGPEVLEVQRKVQD